jgi:hypothetical protein
MQVDNGLPEIQLAPVDIGVAVVYIGIIVGIGF